MRKFLIIDDEWETQKSKYSDLFPAEKYELIYFPFEIEKYIDLARYLEPDINAVIIDLILVPNNEGQSDEVNAISYEILLEILAIIGHKKPIIFQSKVLNIVTSWISNIQQKQNYNIIYFFSWEEIFRPSNRVIKENAQKILAHIEYRLTEFYKENNIELKSSDNINILLISDLQFGDPSFESASYLSPKNIADQLRKDKLEPDLIFILGDVTFSGNYNQYRLAHEFILKLTQEIFDTPDFANRIVVIPGNHDVNYSLGLSDYIQYLFPSERKDPAFFKTRDTIISDQKKVMLMPFRFFAYDLTKNAKYIHLNNDLFWIDKSYSNLGLLLVILNTGSSLSVIFMKYICILMI